MILIPVILLVLALCVAVVAGLAWSSKLPGNNWIGIRAPEARKSQENWNITHRVAGPPWAVAAVAGIGAAALAFLAIRPDASGWMWLWVVVAELASLAMIGVGAAIGSHTIALYDAKLSAQEGEGGCGCGSDDDAGEGCCSSGSADAAAGCADPSADCGVEGGCSNCGLHGMCDSADLPQGEDAAACGSGTGSCCSDSADATGSTASATPAVDLDALRRAAEKQQ